MTLKYNLVYHACLSVYSAVLHLLQTIFNQDLKNNYEIIYWDVLYYFSI